MWFLQFLLVRASGDRTATPTHCQLEMYMDNLPQETNKSPHGSGLEETKAGSPTAAVPMLLSKTSVFKMASAIITPTNFRRHLWGRFITWFWTGPSVSSPPQPFCAWTCPWPHRGPAWSQAPLGQVWLSVKESTFQMAKINNLFPD